MSSLKCCGLIVLVGCSGGSVGADACDNMECTALSLSQGDDPSSTEDLPIPQSNTETVVVQPLAELPIEWIKRLPGPSTLLDGFSNRLLKSDARGLAVFYVSEQRRSLHLARLDDVGEVVQQVDIPDPEGWAGGAETMIGFAGIDGPCWQVCAREDGISINAGWVTEQPVPGVDWIMQKLIYSEDLGAPPVRRTLPERDGDLLQDRNGDLYLLASSKEDGASVSKLDRGTGRELWKQGGFEDPRKFADDAELSLVGVPLDDGRLAIFSHPSDHTKGAYLTFFDAEGARTPTNIGLDQGAYLLNGGTHAKYVFEQLGNIFVADLSEPNYYETVQFQRDEYTLLEPEAAAIDPSGNVYVATHNGSRLDPKPTLCRAAASGTGECYTLPSNVRANEKLRFDSFVVRDNGDVYINSGHDLLHVKYPQ